MNRRSIIGDIRAVWDTLSYGDKLHYIYGYITAKELDAEVYYKAEK
jgi:hypothetical protein